MWRRMHKIYWSAWNPVSWVHSFIAYWFGDYFEYATRDIVITDVLAFICTVLIVANVWLLFLA